MKNANLASLYIGTLHEEINSRLRSHYKLLFFNKESRYSLSTSKIESCTMI